MLLFSLANLAASRLVANTAELKAAMDDATVSDIIMAGGVYHLADEPGLGCSLMGSPFYLCITRDLTIRAAAGAEVVLDGKMGGVVAVGGALPPFVSVITSLQGPGTRDHKQHWHCGRVGQRHRQ